MGKAFTLLCVYTELLETCDMVLPMRTCMSFPSTHLWFGNVNRSTTLCHRTRLSFRIEFIEKMLRWDGRTKTCLKREEFLRCLSRFETSVTSWTFRKITVIGRRFFSSCKLIRNISLGVMSTSRSSKILLTVTLSLATSVSSRFFDARKNSRPLLLFSLR